MSMISTDPEIHLAEQARLVIEIVDMMVGIAVEPADAEWSAGQEVIRASVCFSGPWNGALVLECTPGLAFEFTARFMSVDQPESVNDDVLDSIGELANMIAGNFKALLPSGSHLSIPKVRFGPDLPASTEVGWLSHSAFQTAFGNCRLTLESNPSAACPAQS